jgi:acetyltransferase-like isoleucine patch superfamily enzyme
MRGKRLKVTLRLLTMRSSFKRAQYLKKHNIFRHIGENCSIVNWVLPLYPQIIKLGDNVHIASNVGFVTHDITHLILNHSELAKSVGVNDFGKNSVALKSGIMFLWDLAHGFFTM